MTLGLLCSGQGLQSALMFALTADERPATSIFDEAAEILGCDPRRLVAESDASKLYDNLTGQVLCVVQSLAARACLEEALPERMVIAGYSVGEMAAWSIAGAWTSREALSLVRARAHLMDQASNPGDCLCAVRGLDRVLIENLCEKHGCEIAIINPDRLFIIGGASPGIDRLCIDALAAGATRSSRLTVNVASHTSRMEGAIAPFQLAIDSARPSRLTRGRTLLSGADGTPIVDPAADSRTLARQLGSRLDWAACLEAMVEARVDRILELGPGQALAKMSRDLSLFEEVRALDDFRSMEGVRNWIVRA